MSYANTAKYYVTAVDIKLCWSSAKKKIETFILGTKNVLAQYMTTYYYISKF